MSTQITSKLAAFAVAFMINCLLLGAVAQLFDSRFAHPVTAHSTERAAEALYWAA